MKEIVEQLSKHQIPKGVEIRTVDGFQGREKEIILISLVRSNDQEEIGFLTNQQRMNVLLTRAKCAMIIFGNKQTLRSNDLWREWIDHAPNISAHQFTCECLIQPTQTIDATTQKQRPRQRQRRR